MRLLRLAALAVLLSGALQASITAPPKPPPPGWPTESYVTFVERCREIDLVVFEFRDGRKVFIADSTWLTTFQAALAIDNARPNALCFCIGKPTMKLYAKEKLVCSFEIPHEDKVRFGGSDFVVPTETRQTLAKLLALALKNDRYAPAKTPPKHAPARVDLKP